MCKQINMKYYFFITFALRLIKEVVHTASVKTAAPLNSKMRDL